MTEPLTDEMRARLELPAGSTLQDAMDALSRRVAASKDELCHACSTRSAERPGPGLCAQCAERLLRHERGLIENGTLDISRWGGDAYRVVRRLSSIYEGDWWLVECLCGCDRRSAVYGMDVRNYQVQGHDQFPPTEFVPPGWTRTADGRDFVREETR